MSSPDAGNSCRIENRLKGLTVNDNVRSFNVSVSNPPYQRDTGSGAVALYHHIMSIAQLFSKNISMIYPARWIIGGRGEGIEDFRNKELSSQHYRTFIVHPGENEVFEDNNIKGGVNYFHWTVNSVDSTTYKYNQITEVRQTLLNNNPIMILDPRFSKIVTKVRPSNFITVKPRNYYGIHLEADYNIEKLSETVPEELRNVKIGEEDFSQVTRIYYSGKAGGVRTAIIPKNAGKHSDDHYKLMVSRTADPDRKDINTLRRQNRSFVLKPGEISGGSFLQAGLYETEEEAFNALKYLRTVFVIFMFGTITPVPSTTRINYRLIPDINFKTGLIKDYENNKAEDTDLTLNKWTLDFKEVNETLDEQLFKIYSIDEEEQSLMNKVAKSWPIDAPVYGGQLIK